MKDNYDDRKDNKKTRTYFRLRQKVTHHRTLYLYPV